MLASSPAFQWSSPAFADAGKSFFIEHFDDPVDEFKTLSKHLAPNGIIAGTTDFHQGGSLWNNKYLFPKDHVSYFHHDSLSHLCDLLELECVLFEMEWSRKDKAIQNRRAFVIYRKDSAIARDAIYRYRQTCPVLPIERGWPRYDIISVINS